MLQNNNQKQFNYNIEYEIQKLLESGLSVAEAFREIKEKALLQQHMQRKNPTNKYNPATVFRRTK
ncbi:MAG: hypothetical protein FWG64_14355 [Firmicutes bacterium]|nr:hypothetical protein [Bacillota bacterium]